MGVEDAFPVAVGRTELELGYSYSTAARAFDDGGDTFPRGDNAAHIGAFTAKHGFTSFLDAAVGVLGAYFEPEGRRFATKLRFVALASEARPRIPLGAPFLVEARGRVHGLESNRSIKLI